MTQETAKRRYNLRDVADRAQVSVATVSRVLNSPAVVSPDTRSRVQTAMAELKFVPSAAARAMNSGRSRVVAALLPTLDNAIYARVVNGLETGLNAHGLSLVVAQTRDDQDIKVARAKELINIGAEGFIVSGVTHSEAFHDLMEFSQLPVVAVSYFDPQNRIPTVGYDNWKAARVAADHLLDLGHRDIAVVLGPLDINDRTYRRYQALTAPGQVGRFTFHEVEMSLGGGADAVNRILADRGDTTAILCFSDILAMGVLNQLHQAGLSVPNDISVLGIENLPAAQHTYPALTSVRMGVEKMGELAADALANWLETHERPQPVELDVALMERSSTAPPKR